MTEGPNGPHPTLILQHRVLSIATFPQPKRVPHPQLPCGRISSRRQPDGQNYTTPIPFFPLPAQSTSDYRSLGQSIALGFFEAHINGGNHFGLRLLSEAFKGDLSAFNCLLVQPGVASYLPSIPTSRPKISCAVPPRLGRSGFDRLIRGSWSKKLGSLCRTSLSFISKI